MAVAVEVVKIFDHMLFLAVSQFDNISRRKLIWIVSYGLVNHLGCYAIQFSNISVKDNLRIPDDNDFTFCFYNIFLMSHNFFFKSYSGDKENANERKESLLSICRVQLFFCKENANERKESLFSICRVQLFLLQRYDFSS